MKSFRLDRSRFERQKARLRAALDDRARAAMEAAAGKLVQVSAEVAREIAERSFPLPAMLEGAMASIRADIGRVFITPGQAFEILRQHSGRGPASAFYAAYEKGDFTRARAVLQMSGGPIRGIRIGTVQPELHEQARSPETGRVTLSAPLVIVPKGQLESYVRQCWKEIGKTASGWNACALKLGGGEGGGQWKSTSVHGSAGGTVSLRRDGGQVVCVIENLRPLARKHLPAGQLAVALAKGHARFLELLGE